MPNDLPNQEQQQAAPAQPDVAAAPAQEVPQAVASALPQAASSAAGSVAASPAVKQLSAVQRMKMELEGRVATEYQKKMKSVQAESKAKNAQPQRVAVATPEQPSLVAKSEASAQSTAAQSQSTSASSSPAASPRLMSQADFASILAARRAEIEKNAKNKAEAKAAASAPTSSASLPAAAGAISDEEFGVRIHTARLERERAGQKSLEMRLGLVSNDTVEDESVAKNNSAQHDNFCPTQVVIPSDFSARKAAEEFQAASACAYPLSTPLSGHSHLNAMHQENKFKAEDNKHVQSPAPAAPRPPATVKSDVLKAVQKFENSLNDSQKALATPFLQQVRAMHKSREASQFELLNAIRFTSQLLISKHEGKEQQLSTESYLRYAKSMEHASSPGLRALGVIMMALGIAIAAVALSAPPVTATVALAAGGGLLIGEAFRFFEAGRARGISATMTNLGNAKQAEDDSECEASLR